MFRFDFMTRTEFKKKFQALLKSARQSRHLTQLQLASITGLSPDWISHFECGRRLPDACALYRLAQAVGAATILS
jgi:transcriptional regulator with XRE-family HTH domain